MHKDGNLNTVVAPMVLSVGSAGACCPALFLCSFHDTMNRPIQQKSPRDLGVYVRIVYMCCHLLFDRTKNDAPQGKQDDGNLVNNMVWQCSDC